MKLVYKYNKVNVGPVKGRLQLGDSGSISHKYAMLQLIETTKGFSNWDGPYVDEVNEIKEKYNKIQKLKIFLDEE